MPTRICTFISFMLLTGLTASAQLFNQVKTAPADKRGELATAIYKTQFRKTDSATTFRALEELEHIGESLQDKELPYKVLEFKADYLSVNRGFNPLSIKYLQQAIDLAVSERREVKRGIYIFKKGQFYNTFQKYSEAYENYLGALSIFKDEGFEQVPEISYYLNVMADFYYKIGDFDNAKDFLLKALRYNTTSGRSRINMINTIGLIWRNKGNYPEALKYFGKALNEAILTKDFVWEGIAKGNIGFVYFLQKKYAAAMPYLQTDYNTSLKYHEEGNAAIAMLRIIRIQLEGKKTKEAKKNIGIVENILSKKKDQDHLAAQIDLLRAKSDLYEQLEQPLLAIAMRKELEAAKDSLANRKNFTIAQQIQMKFELDKHQDKINKLETISKTERWERNALISILILLFIISVLLFNRQKLMRKNEKADFQKEQMLLQLENLKKQEALLVAQTKLNRYTTSLKQKNAMLEGFKAEIASMKSKLKGPEEQTRLVALEKLMHAQLMTNENWKDFKKLFDKVYEGFFIRAKEQYLHLTETDIRYFALIRLKLSNREMAGMLGITTEGIKKSKQRLRKKMALKITDNLEAIIEVI